MWPGTGTGGARSWSRWPPTRWRRSTASDRVPLAPMNPFERKIVHDAVAAAGLTSESEGEEPRRHVVVLPV